MELSLSTNYHPKGAECGCPNCGRIFASERAYETHRVGNHSVGRKCADYPEYAGLTLDLKGRWATPKSNTK